MRIIIAGPRDFYDYEELKKAIESSKIDITEVVSGGATGVDSMGERWASENKVLVRKFPAKWKDLSEPCVLKKNQYGNYNALAGFKRNTEMSEYADGLIAICAGTPGTDDMVDRMLFLDKTVYQHFVELKTRKPKKSQKKTKC